MSDIVQGVLFTDGQNRIFLFPPEPYSDGHGFHHRVDVVANPFVGSIDASSYEGTKALRGFHQQLAVLYKNLIGEASLPSSYDNIRLSLKGDGMGHVAVEAELRAGFAMSTQLRFGFSIDQTQLLSIMNGIEQFLPDSTISDS